MKMWNLKKIGVTLAASAALLSGFSLQADHISSGERFEIDTIEEINRIFARVSNNPVWIATRIFHQLAGDVHDLIVLESNFLTAPTTAEQLVAISENLNGLVSQLSADLIAAGYNPIRAQGVANVLSGFIVGVNKVFIDIETGNPATAVDIALLQNVGASLALQVENASFVPELNFAIQALINTWIAQYNAYNTGDFAAGIAADELAHALAGQIGALLAFGD